MSTNCPECGQALDQDFGVVTCPQCASVLFIDMDGNAQLSKNDSQQNDFESEGFATNEPSLNAAVATSSEVESWNNQSWENGTPQSEESSIPAEVGFSPHRNPGPSEALWNNENSTTPAAHETVEMNSHELDYGQEPAPLASLSNSGSDGDFEDIHSENSPSLERDAADSTDHFQSVAQPFDPDSLELIGDAPQSEMFVETSAGLETAEPIQFSNQDQDFGPLTYSVIIENIDTKEVRIQLQDALTDSKFQWDPKALMKEIKMGALKLENINPVKASVLIERLQAVPVKVSWSQHAYS